MIHIVDDNLMLRELLVELIEEFGGRAIAFASPSDYLSYFNSEEYSKPCGVLTDVNMPDMSGYELMERVLQQEPDIRFAMMSGEPYLPSEHKHKVCIYLCKPFSPEHVGELMNKFRCCATSHDRRLIGCRCFGDRHAFGQFDFKCPKNTPVSGRPYL